MNFNNYHVNKSFNKNPVMHVDLHNWIFLNNLNKPKAITKIIQPLPI